MQGVSVGGRIRIISLWWEKNQMLLHLNSRWQRSIHRVSCNNQNSFIVIIVGGNSLPHKNTIHTHHSLSAGKCHGSLFMDVLTAGEWVAHSNTCSPSCHLAVLPSRPPIAPFKQRLTLNSTQQRTFCWPLHVYWVLPMCWMNMSKLFPVTSPVAPWLIKSPSTWRDILCPWLRMLPTLLWKSAKALHP